MPRNSSLTIRRLGNGASAPKGKNGKFLRVSVHKTTRKVEKVQPNNWTEAGNTLFTQLYPEGLAFENQKEEAAYYGYCSGYTSRRVSSQGRRG